VDGEADDPFSDGKCHTPRVNSYGGYVYAWPSKYDIVYWPFIDANWLWYCPKSGYASFGNDFGELSETEHEAVTALLSERYEGGIGEWNFRRRLLWAEEIYRARDTDLRFWSWFYRLLAYLHGDDAKESEKYVRKALPLLQRQLESLKAGIEIPTVLYLLGEYHRRLGKTDAARGYFDKAKSWSGKDEGSDKANLVYLKEIIAERQALLK